MDSPIITLYNQDALLIHYELPQGVHQMDASIEAACTLAFVKLVKKIAEVYEIEIEIDTIACTEGGLKHWLKIVKEKEDKDAPITSEVIKHILKFLAVSAISLTSGGLVWLVSALKSCSSPEINAERCIEYISQHQDEFVNNPQIKAYRAKFYQHLQKEQEVSDVTFDTYDTLGNTLATNNVPKMLFETLANFEKELEPGIDDNAVIQITAPVLTKGKYNTWHGIYNGVTISFSMCSNEFKTLVQNGEIKFVNGTSLKCHLEYSRTLLEDGGITNSNYKVLRVDKCFDADTNIETNEGKVYKKKKELDNAPNLFTGFEDNF